MLTWALVYEEHNPQMESRVPHHIPGVSSSIMVQPLLNSRIPYGRLQHPLTIYPIDQMQSLHWRMTTSTPLLWSHNSHQATRQARGDRKSCWEPRTILICPAARSQMPLHIPGYPSVVVPAPSAAAAAPPLIKSCWIMQLQPLLWIRTLLAMATAGP